MSPQTINVLLIEDSSDYAELVEQWLGSATEHEHFNLHWTDSLAQGLNRLGEGGVDVVLLDLGLPDSNGMPTFIAVRDQSRGVPVVVLSAADNEALALHTIQEGAQDYLVKSTCNRDLLLRAVRYTVFRHRALQKKVSGESGAGGRVVGILGAKGGVGVTTFACNFADGLSSQTGERVLLADLDMHCGSVSFVMGVEPKFTAQAALENVDHLDVDCWRSIVAEKSDCLHILASPAFLGQPEPAQSAAVSLIKQIAPLYRWVIADLGPPNPFSRGMLEHVDEVLIVSTPEIPALYETKRMIDSLVQGGMERERFRLVINKAEAQSVSAVDLKKMFGLEVQAVLPNAPGELREACMAHRLPAENTRFRKEIVRLARKTAGLPEPAPGRLQQLLSLGGRSRGSASGNRLEHS